MCRGRLSWKGGARRLAIEVAGVIKRQWYEAAEALILLSHEKGVDLSKYVREVRGEPAVETCRNANQSNVLPTHSSGWGP